MLSNRYYLVNYDRIFWILVAQTHYKLVREGKYLHNNNDVNFNFTTNFRQYVVDYKCTNNIDSSWFIRDASKSFPSGHSSTSFYEAVFLIW